MPIISFASPKGGCGKTTSALLLATELAQKGAGVTVIDADPETWIYRWSQMPDKPENLKIVPAPKEDTIIDIVEKAAKETPFVIIDLEGTANMLVSYAVSLSDFIIIPSQPSDLDSRGAAKAIRLVKEQERLLKKQIPHAILFTRTSATIRTRAFKNIQLQLKKANINVFETQLIERQAFKDLFSYGGTLETMNEKQSYNLEKAVKNAKAYAAEVVQMIKKTTPQSNKQPEKVRVA